MASFLIPSIILGCRTGLLEMQSRECQSFKGFLKQQFRGHHVNPTVIKKVFLCMLRNMTWYLCQLLQLVSHYPNHQMTSCFGYLLPFHFTHSVLIGYFLIQLPNLDFIIAGVHSFDFLGLGYRVDWPVSIILTPNALKIYSEIFSFLIQVKLAVFSLTDIWCLLKVCSLLTDNSDMFFMNSSAVSS